MEKSSENVWAKEQSVQLGSFVPNDGSAAATASSCTLRLLTGLPQNGRSFMLQTFTPSLTMNPIARGKISVCFPPSFSLPPPPLFPSLLGSYLYSIHPTHLLTTPPTPPTQLAIELKTKEKRDGDPSDWRRVCRLSGACPLFLISFYFLHFFFLFFLRRRETKKNTTPVVCRIRNNGPV